MAETTLRVRLKVDLVPYVNGFRAAAGKDALTPTEIAEMVRVIAAERVMRSRRPRFAKFLPWR